MNSSEISDVLLQINRNNEINNEKNNSPLRIDEHLSDFVYQRKIFQYPEHPPTMCN